MQGQHPPPRRPSALDLFHSQHPSQNEEDQHPPPTPPYRQEASASQELVVGRAQPPDYRSEINVSRDHFQDPEKAQYSREMSRNSSRERISIGDRTRNNSIESPHVPTAKGVRYPDLEGNGALSNIPPRPVRNMSTFSDGTPGNSNPGSRAPSIAASDVEDYDDDRYDWSDEEDLVDQEAKFGKKMGKGEKKRGFSFTSFLTFFFSTLIGSVMLSAALVAVPILLRILWLNKDRSEHRQYVYDNVAAWCFWAAANVTISWWLASLIDILPHIFTLVVGVVWGHVSEVMKSKIEMYKTGKGWVKPPFYAACAWVAWTVLFDGIFDLYEPENESLSRAPYTPRVYQAIRFLFFLVLVVSIEKMLVQVIAFSFHRTAFQERLDGVAKATKVLDHLRDFRPTPSSTTYKRRSRFTSEPATMEEGFIADRDSDTENEKQTSKMKQKSASSGEKRSSKGWFGSYGKQSSTGKDSIALQDQSPQGSRSGSGHSYPPLPPPSRPRSPAPARTPESGSSNTDAVIVTAAKALKTVVLHDARNMRSDKTEDEDLGYMVSSAHEAKKLAREIYFSFKSDRKRTYLIPSDFYCAYPTQDEAKEAFLVFDKNDNGDITRPELKTAVMKVYKERRFLARSLRDVSAAVTTLDRIMLCGSMVVLFFISLSIFGVSIGSSISSIYTIFIAASFIFKNTASNAFDAIMFLFVTHPFDTGDRCFIDNENLIVKKMGLFATTFIRGDGSQTYYFNSMLFTKFIGNQRRSGNMWESCEMQVNWRTPWKKLEVLEQCLNEWIQSDERRWFLPGTTVVPQKIEFQRSLELTIGIGHNGTWQDWGLRLARKTAFHAAVQFYCRQLDITWSESPQPVIFQEDTTSQPYLDDTVLVDEPFGDGADPTTPVTPTATPGRRTTPHKSTANGGATEPVRAMLGFLPPKEGKSQLRLRKSRPKKNMGAGMD